MSTSIKKRIHHRADLTFPVRRVRSLAGDPLNRVSYQMGPESQVALTAAIEYVATALLRDAHKCAKNENRERVRIRDLLTAVDKAPGLYKPLLGDHVVFGNAGVSVHFEPRLKPTFRASAGSHTRRSKVVTRNEDDDQDDEDEELEGSDDLAEPQEPQEPQEPPARKTRRRANAKNLAHAAASAANKKKRKSKKKTARNDTEDTPANKTRATRKKRTAPAASPRKQPASKRSRKE